MSGVGPTAVRLGLRTALRQRAAVLWTFVLVVVGALPLAAAFGWLVHYRLGHSLVADRFARGLDPILWTELLRAEHLGLESLLPVLAGGLVPWALVATYCEGAILAVASRVDPCRTGEFFAAAGNVYGRLLRLLALGAPFVVAVAGGAGWAMYHLADRCTGPLASEKIVLAVRVAAVFAVVLVASWALGTYDLMRVEAVARGEHRARNAFIRGLARGLRHPFSLLLTTLPFSGGALLLTVVASLLDARCARLSWAWLVGVTLLQQLTTAARSFLKVALAGAEVAFVLLAGGILEPRGRGILEPRGRGTRA